MIIARNTTVAVVDGEKLRLFKNTGDTDIELSPIDTPALTDAGSASRGHHSSSANPDNQTQAEDEFAGSVAALFNKQSQSGELSALVVVAAPKTLGELRKHWSKELEAKIAGEIAKDLTKHSVADITATLQGARSHD